MGNSADPNQKTNDLDLQFAKAGAEDISGFSRTRVDEIINKKKQLRQNIRGAKQIILLPPRKSKQSHHPVSLPGECIPRILKI